MKHFDLAQLAADHGMSPDQFTTEIMQTAGCLGLISIDESGQAFVFQFSDSLGPALITIERINRND